MNPVEGFPSPADADAADLVRRLLGYGWRPSPLPLAGWDVQLTREQGGYVDVVVAGEFGDAVIARYVAAYEPTKPRVYQGRVQWRQELPLLEALRHALRIAESERWGARS